jgi:hypothetical protein
VALLAMILFLWTVSQDATVDRDWVKSMVDLRFISESACEPASI